MSPHLRPKEATHRHKDYEFVLYYVENNKVYRWSLTYPAWDFCAFVNENTYDKMVPLN